MKNLILTLPFTFLATAAFAQEKSILELSKDKFVIVDGRILKDNRDTLIGRDKK